MKTCRLIAGLAALMLTPALPAQQPGEMPVPTKVMIVGTMHFANPGLDYRNLAVDDVLAPKRQREITAIVQALSRFSPTAIGVEWRDDAASAAYAKYKNGALPPSRDETVQLGFALAKLSKIDAVHGLGMPADLPFELAVAFAQAHGKQAIIDRVTAVSDKNVAAQEKSLKTKGIAATLRLLNDPVAANDTHSLYRELLKLGAGDDQPGLEATATWYRRNLGICAKLMQAIKPGDHMIVFIGAGHLTLMQQCVRETPGFSLIDARDYLPH
ncbi:DUF5694 domain-containing protein [Sphingomonas mucosissima]|uniref:TraB family protein n=1 Tax=Sphingomonas mucosissima TaxID=370959 RepID=A0A245ZFI6_9SPHN|nr:DUF5694 domain-containing protein [Sphingomonas mucosissima]OWK28507.1 hypothetical protein SPMU_27680 [Sphingomonas mucosissima]